MRLISWNMSAGFGFEAEKHIRAWEFLRDELKPDVALLQEAVPPPWADNEWSLLAHRKLAPH